MIYAPEIQVIGNLDLDVLKNVCGNEIMNFKNLDDNNNILTAQFELLRF